MVKLVSLLQLVCIHLVQHCYLGEEDCQATLILNFCHTVSHFLMCSSWPLIDPHTH